MSKTLVIAEKPSVGRELARVLGCSQNGNGFISGPKYIVSWALGHLVTLADPEAYGEQYKTWKLEDLPMLPSKMQLVVIKETAKQFNVLKSLIHRQDVTELVLATDSGREGELVGRWIFEKIGVKKPVKRLWIYSQTDRAIKEGYNALKPSSHYNNLYQSARCRAEADWYVGLNITRALTCKYNAQLSAGRVQTPTLAMIVAREEEIRRFVPKDYWTIAANVNGYTISWVDRKNGQMRLFDKQRADIIFQRVTGQKAVVTEVRKEAKQELPPLAYDLTELQRDANRRYGYSAKKTLNIMQQVYETHKLVTYPRTDSRYITEDMVPTLLERLKSIAVGPYAACASSLIRNKLKVTKRFVDNTKVTDHHAIIPTEQYVDLGALNSEERAIYDLIVKRFMAVLSAPFEYELTTVSLEAAGELFQARGRIIRAKGWKAVEEDHEFQEDEEDDGVQHHQALPEIHKGDEAQIRSVRAVPGKTKPPARYTEATLLSAMEHPGKFIDDKTLRDTIESTSGLGTPATRADIIEKLFSAFYIERKGKEILPTSKGIQLVGLVPEEIKSPELTAKWERELALISKGKANPDGFIGNMKAYAASLVSQVIASTEAFRHDNLTRERCPQCGKYLLDVAGKKGRMLVCQDRECGFRKSVSILSNARCPECHKKMELKGEGESKSFYCTCGYREKLEAFNARKREHVTKKEVGKFLKQQDTGETINSALADALAKWKQ